MLIGTSSLSAHGEDLLDVYRLALRNDPTFEVARYTLKAASEKYPQALAGLLPTVSVNGANNVTRAQNEFSNTVASERQVHAWNWTLQLIQPLFRVQNLYAYDEAQLSVVQAQAQYNLAEQEMILRVTQAYFGVLTSRESIKVAEAELAATEEQLELAKRGFEKGIAAITDVRDGQSRADLARSHLVTARNDLDGMNAELAKIVDEVPDRLAALDPAVSIPSPQPNDQKIWISQARDNNPAVRAAQSGLLAAEAAVGKTRAEHAPTLDLVASYGENYSSGSTTLSTDYAWRGQSKQIGIQFNVPLFAGGGTNSRVTEAIANKYRAGAELEVAHRQSATDARQAFAGVVNGLSQIAALKSSVESSQSAVDGSHDGYKLGVYSNIDVLNAEQQLHTAKRDLVKARYETLFQALKLKAAAGILSADDLIAANALLVHEQTKTAP
ncbi:MAG: TolC family outer membrane protein [Sideroxydans sp.]|nr:TolC family outer membrane protein [Sideroxydans sp.]